MCGGVPRGSPCLPILVLVLVLVLVLGPLDPDPAVGPSTSTSTSTNEAERPYDLRSPPPSGGSRRLRPVVGAGGWAAEIAGLAGGLQGLADAFAEALVDLGGHQHQLAHLHRGQHL